MAPCTDVVGSELILPLAHSSSQHRKLFFNGFLVLIIIMMGYIAYKRFNLAISSTGKAIALAYLGYYAALLFATFFTGTFVPTAAAGGGTGPFIEASYRWFFFGLVLSIPNWDEEAAASELSVQ